MTTRPLSLIALIQLGVAVFGYLLTLSAIKLGFISPRWFETVPRELLSLRNYGLLLLVVPALWTPVAIYAESKRKEGLCSVLHTVGIGLVAGVAAVFVYCFTIPFVRRAIQ